jgi:hypothetical protein
MAISLLWIPFMHKERVKIILSAYFDYDKTFTYWNFLLLYVQNGMPVTWSIWTILFMSAKCHANKHLYFTPDTVLRPDIGFVCVSAFYTRRPINQTLGPNDVQWLSPGRHDASSKQSQVRRTLQHASVEHLPLFLQFIYKWSVIWNFVMEPTRPG